MGKKALITGIAGQDGSYLAEYLLSLGYEVHGTIRRNSTPENQETRINHLEGSISTYYSDLLDAPSLYKVISKIQPDENYNLAAQSHVRISFDVPSFTVQTNALGVLTLLEAYKEICPTARFYQASSSEMFGSCVDADGFQRETTQMCPVSPYGCAKVFGYNITRHYRNAYGLFISNGVLFNHESMKYDHPLLVKYQGLIDIHSIQDLAKKFANFTAEKDNKTGTPVEDLYVWDNEDWTPINCISWFKDKKKNVKIINARNSVYSVTDDHVCVLKDGSEVKAIELRLKDKVKTITYPIGEKENDVTLEEAELLGMLVGDGTLKHKHFTNKDKKLRDRFEYLWQMITKGNGWCRYYPSISGFTGEVVGMLDFCGDSEFAKKFQIDTDCVDVFGRTYKKVPVQILNSTPDVMEAFLVGYNATDGLKSNPCTYRFKNFKTNSPVLAAGLLYLINKATKQRFNITVEECWKWGKQQFYYSINLLSDSTSSLGKHKIVKEKLAQRLSQREIQRQTGVSRTMIRKIQAGYVPSNTHRLELANDEIKKIITIPNYTGWLFDVETKSGTLHGGIGTGLIHNSPRRGSNFVTVKVVKTAVQIKLGMKDKLELGNMDSYRDWGHSKDYVRAMHQILNYDKPDDFVVSTGITWSVRDMCDYVFSKLGMNYKDYVVQNPKYIRPEELPYLKGDCTKAKTILGWKPEYTFEQMMDEIICHWERFYANGGVHSDNQ